MIAALIVGSGFRMIVSVIYPQDGVSNRHHPRGIAKDIEHWSSLERTSPNI
jgi:hypothetical protein